MQEITSLTSSAKQQHRLVLDNNDTVDFYLYFLERQRSWYYSFTYQDITVNCSKIVITPNSLRNYKKVLPFGLAFMSDGEIDPYKQDDFSSGRVKMYVLNSDEVEEIENTIYSL